MKTPESNYRFFLEAMRNQRPERMPIYEHHIDAGFIEKATGHPMTALLDGTTAEKKVFFQRYVDFWQNCGYDIVTFELGIPLACPGSGALREHADPVIRTPADVEAYPWDRIADWYFEQNAEYFELFAEEVLKRDNIRGVGGPGYGIFETVQDLVSYMAVSYTHLKMLVAASSYRDTVGGSSGYSLFKDVKSSHWAVEYIKVCVENGWLVGYMDGTFRPNQTITLEEAATVALRLLGYTASDLAGSYPTAQLAKFNALGLHTGFSTARWETMTRSDCAYLFYNLMAAQTKDCRLYTSAPLQGPWWACRR